MDALCEADVYAQLTGLRDTLRVDGYELELLGTTPQISLAIAAGPDACEDCLVGKELMTAHVVAALAELDADVSPDDVLLMYPGERRIDTTVDD